MTKRPTPPGVREAILDSAERRLREAGPGAIRLQEVAREVGVSHPAILHHFGSREGLVQAVVDRAIRTLQEDLAGALANQAERGPDGVDLFARVLTVLEDKGHARLLAWLVLSGHDAIATDAARAGWQKIAEVTHGMRVGSSRRKVAPSYEDTRFTIVLSALALFGQAIAGPVTFDLAGFGQSKAVGRRFRRWLAEVLASHMKGGGASA